MRENPVEDIDIDSKTTLADLNSQFAKAGGFVAAKVATATSIIQDMNQGECTKFISFPADIMATGTRGLIRQFVERGMTDVVVTTCGTLDHDIARVLSDYYHGDFMMDDQQLRRKALIVWGMFWFPMNLMVFRLRTGFSRFSLNFMTRTSAGFPGRSGMNLD